MTSQVGLTKRTKGRLVGLTCGIGAMRKVEAREAKARLVELLRAVERGESFSTVRHGKAIAHLVPAAADDQARRDAPARCRARRRERGKVALTAGAIRDAGHEGHRA